MVEDVLEDNQGDSEVEDLTDDNGYLPLRVKRRYAKAKAVFEVGVWSSRSIDLLLSVMIGSMRDVRNSYPELRQDNENMRKELKKMGLDYADCLCGELSPESHEFRKRDGSLGITKGRLWHLHGFFRFREFIKAADVHSFLSPLWGKIHGSEVVNVKIETNFEKAIKYSVKDAVKHYSSGDNANKRLLMSRNWLPEGYREVNKVLTEWALYHGAKWNFDDDLDSFVNNEQYVAFAWEQKRDYVRRWCQGETILLDFRDYQVKIDGSRIIRGVEKVEEWALKHHYPFENELGKLADRYLS
jgi:hypothetical protein